MPKTIIYTVLLFLLIGYCLYAGKKKPEWISNPYSQYPSKPYLCAVGMAKELTSAQNDALQNIAGSFETRVISVTTSMESENSSSSNSQTSSEPYTSVKAI